MLRSLDFQTVSSEHVCTRATDDCAHTAVVHTAQVKQLAAEVLDHLRSSLDAELLTGAFTEARARSAAAKVQRRKQAAVKVRPGGGPAAAMPSSGPKHCASCTACSCISRWCAACTELPAAWRMPACPS